MNNNSDPEFDPYVDLEFGDAKPVSAIPTLMKLRADQGGKARITIRVDNDTLAVFRVKAEMTGANSKL